MNSNNYRKLAIVILLSTLVPAVGQAAVPRAMLEKSAAYALDSQVRAFRVPTVDSTGKIKFYDVTIKLAVHPDGTLDPLADVTASLSRVVTTGVIPPGTYKAADGATCNVTNITLTNGRIQSFFTCKDAALRDFELSVATGRVTAGHPYLAELVAAGIDKRLDVATQTWGIVTNGFFAVGTCASTSFNSKTPIGAKTNGSKLILSVFGKTSPSVFVCGATLTKQP